MILSVSNAYKSFGATTVFENITFEIRGSEKIALIGKNGCGKTTLLKLIANELTLDKGQIHKRNDVRVGYLAQMTFANETNTVKQEIQSIFKDILQMQAELNDLAAAMATDHSEKTLLRYANLQQEFEERGGYTYEAEARSVVTKFGFTEEDLNRKIATFSGGQKTKLAFAKLLLSKPDVLLLDEPTNHLDLQTIQWLEGYLKKYERAVVVVSHDRYFLDEIADEVYELSLGAITRYAGNYSRYLEQKAKDIEKNAQAYQRQQKEIERLEDLIEKFRYKKNKAAFAQSKIKYLDRMEKVQPLDVDERRMKVRFTPKSRGGKSVLEVDNLKIGYDKELSQISLEVLRGQRIAILGPNGEGKSTFLKTIMGLVPKLGGEYLFGHQIEVGYFDQQMAQLNTNRTVLEELWEEHPDVTHTQIRTILGCFLFTNEDVFKLVSSLSGGEKVRLSLAKLMLDQGNFLILDEPTNHLDIESKEVLETALQDFEGSILFVSHDRYFIKRMANGILEMNSGSAVFHAGSYDAFMGKENASQNSAEKSAAIESVSKVERKERVQQERELKKIEKMIGDKEVQLEALRNKRFDEAYYHDFVKMKELDEEIDFIHNEINQLMETWENLHS